VLAVCFTLRDTRNHSSEHEEVTQRVGVLLNGEALLVGSGPNSDASTTAASAAAAPSAHRKPRAPAAAACPHCQNSPGSGRFCIECAPTAQAAGRPRTQSASPFSPPATIGASPSPQPRYRPRDAAAHDPLWRAKQRAAAALKLALGPGVELRLAADEAGLFDALVALVAEADPDFLVGWEVQMASLGYLLERAQHLGLSGLLRRLSRVRASSRHSPGQWVDEADTWGCVSRISVPIGFSTSFPHPRHYATDGPAGLPSSLFAPPPPPPQQQRPQQHPQQHPRPGDGYRPPQHQQRSSVTGEQQDEEDGQGLHEESNGIEHVAERRDDAWGMEQVNGTDGARRSRSIR
jgi:hypothetical protein